MSQRRILTRFSFLILAVSQVLAQANIVQPSQKSQPQTPTEPSINATPPSGSVVASSDSNVCDRNGVLLDVLNSIGGAQLAKEEVAYESSKNLNESAIYKRRMRVIKALASKK